MLERTGGRAGSASWSAPEAEEVSLTVTTRKIAWRAAVPETETSFPWEEEKMLGEEEAEESPTEEEEEAAAATGMSSENLTVSVYNVAIKDLFALCDP